MIDRFFEENSWDKIKNSDKPVILYGMGNGADMIIDIFNKYSIRWDDIFASDKFVRGHSFHGKKVLKYNEIKEKYDDFIVVMTFALHDDESIEFVRRISSEHTLLAPTVPVAGDGLFTREFVEENIDKFNKVYELLADEKSRKSFENVVKFKISGKVDYLFEIYSEDDEIYENIFKFNENETILDLGAYDGDTVRKFYEKTNGKYNKIIALEPDKKNFLKLEKNTQDIKDIQLVNAGAWNENTTLYFQKSAGRQSKVTENSTQTVEARTVDSFEENFSFIKMDIEGSEKNALIGAEKTIRSLHPKLYICAYHRNEDLFELPLLIKSFDKSYRFYFRQHKYIPAWESNFYII